MWAAFHSAAVVRLEDGSSAGNPSVVRWAFVRATTSVANWDLTSAHDSSLTQLDSWATAVEGASSEKAVTSAARDPRVARRRRSTASHLLATPRNRQPEGSN